MTMMRMILNDARAGVGDGQGGEGLVRVKRVQSQESRAAGGQNGVSSPAQAGQPSPVNC